MAGVARAIAMATEENGIKRGQTTGMHPESETQKIRDSSLRRTNVQLSTTCL
jgi:hypothetical protein